MHRRKDVVIVQILISTYNGEKYFKDQIESIIKGDFESYEIFVRDDNSTDNTLNIASEFQNSAKLKIIQGSNIGVIKSFFELLKFSDDAAFYAFSDQDDAWYPDKLTRAVESLGSLPEDKPAMFFSRMDIVNENLMHMTYSNIPLHKPCLQNALVENIATGATVIINKAARDLILTKLPDFCIMHDWWVYLVVSAFGNIVYDEKPLIKYRQHGSNVVGYKVGFLNSFISRLKRFNKQDHKQISKQVQEFYDIFGDKLDTEKKQLVIDFLYSRSTFFKRLKYAVTCRVYRQSGIDNFIFKILIILNLI